LVTIRYFGISAFELITEAGVKILIDPCISSNSLSPIGIDDFSDIDLILVTHGAPDHMGDAIELQRRTNATIVSGPAVRVHAWKQGVPKNKSIALLWGDKIEIHGVTVKGVECRHVSFFKSTDGYLTGLPLSFIIVPEPHVCIYNAGDTALFSDLKLIGTLYKPNIALIPIGGSPELTGGFSHLPPQEAALATYWVNPDYVIPTHYQPSTDEAARFRKHLQLLTPSTQILFLDPGDERVYSSQTNRFT
jgi:L-ascorbate metabolism protein UlaG (beta-lactamase superfamily)